GKTDLNRLGKAFRNSNYDFSLDDVQRVQAKGLLKALLSGKVATNYSPGVDFIGDKEFYFYVEDLIRNYLHEEPILTNIGSRKFADKTGKLDSDLVKEVFSNQKKYVIKAVDGRGGDSVWVGPKIPRDKFKSVREQIIANPERF